MEDLLENLSKEAINYKASLVHKATIDAQALLECQQCNTRDPAHALRAKCFHAFKLAFETKRAKLIALSISGIYKMIRDDRFQSNFEPEDDSLWFPSQLLHAFSSIHTQSDDTQVDMLKILLYVACSTYWTVNGRIIIQILTMCSEVHENGTVAIRSASQAASSQILCAFCHFLGTELNYIFSLYKFLSLTLDNKEQEVQVSALLEPEKTFDSIIVFLHWYEECLEVDSNRSSNSAGILCFNEAIPILQFICCKVDETQRGDRCSQSVVFFIECLHTLISNLPQKIHANRHFVTFLWQKLCPVLIAFLGSPRVDKKIISREDRQAGENSETGRGSGGLATAPGFDSYQSKTVYSIGNQLVRLVGCVGSLRPVLESVYHRMLLYPSPEHRLEALKALKEVFRSVNRVVDFAGPILIEDDKQQGCQQSDMALTRLVMDSIEQSARCDNPDVIFACVSCISSLLSTLKELTDGKGISEKYVEKINSCFSTLQSADYCGPLTYDSRNRLPNVYREILEFKMSVENASNASRSSSGHSSGETEGPEEGLNDSDMEEAASDGERRQQDQETERLNKIRKASISDTMSLNTSNIDKSLDVERENARQFTKTLLAFLPSLFQLRSTLQVDEALQEFSSKYCQGVIDSSTVTEPNTIMNADGLYLAIYTALRFNLKLINIGYYVSKNESLPLTEEQFVEEVHGSGVLVYLSASWLSELYQEVLVTNFLQFAGYDQYEKNEYLPLISLLTDTDSELNKYESHILSDYLRLERACFRPEITPEKEAGKKMSRRILTCCWDSMIEVLSIGLQYAAAQNNNSRIKLLKKNRNNEHLLKNCFLTSLESLQKAAELTNILRLQNRCGKIFSLIVSAACPNSTSAKVPIMFLDNNHKLHTSQAFSMDIILSCGLELGSYAPDCWEHIFKCAAYVCHLEQKLFRRTNESVLRKITHPKKKDNNSDSSTSMSVTENLKFTFNSVPVEEDEIMDVYSFLATSPSPIVTAQEPTISEILNEKAADASGGHLNHDVAANVVCLLSQKVDKLFEEAALKLNLSALMGFVKDLCTASHHQLFSRTSNVEKYPRWWRLKVAEKSADVEANNHSLFLSRLNQVMLKCIRGGRPLLHIMKIWSLVGPHYIEAACSKEQTISKISVICIHDAITALLNEQTELPHFHFNEALFKPFEILLCLELCDSDIQDHIVSCICEFVEGNRVDIKSGWRSLYGGLRMVSSAHLASLMNVFKVFLDTDNTLVFSNAAVDFIACLLRHARGTDCVRASVEKKEDGETGLKLAEGALKYLHQSCGILASMYNMPACPIFHAAHCIKIGVSRVEANVLSKQIVVFDANVGEYRDQLEYGILWPDDGCSNDCVTLSSIDRPSGVLRVWFNLIENLAFTCIVAVDQYQSQAVDMLFVILQDLISVPGIDFALFCVNNIILPTVQHWLRKLPTNVILDRTETSAVMNFKQCCGTLTDLIVSYLHHLAGQSDRKKGTLVSKQSMILFTELIENSREGITRLGCACLKHMIFSAGPLFNEEEWTIACLTIHKACVLSFHPLMQLMATFYPCSQSFYGDLAQVKVAARKDSTVEENYRVKQLSQQIFLLENQYDSYKQADGNEVDEERSYVLLLCPAGESQPVIRVPYRNIVLGLLANQLLLQIIATLLIQGTPRVVPSLANVLLQTPNSLSRGDDYKHAKTTKPKLHGLTAFMKQSHIEILFSCLDFSYEKATSFDSRPGLKFLLQKVASLEKATNLYKQAGACWTLKIVALFELFLYESQKLNITPNEVKSNMEKFDLTYENSNEFSFNKITRDDQFEPYVAYLFCLRQSFDRLCEKYVDIVLDKDGMYSVIDSVCDQPIFFLISQAEDFSDFSRRKRSEEVAEAESRTKTPLSSAEKSPSIVANVEDERSAKLSSSSSSSSPSLPSPPVPVKPFMFSDFAELTREPEPSDAVESSVTENDTQKESVKESDGGGGGGGGGGSGEENTDGKLTTQDDDIESVYMMASSRSIDGVVEEYAKRKKSCSMLPKKTHGGTVGCVEPLPPEIEQQRKSSIHKDSEAHLAVWAEVLISVFDILAQLDDEIFRILLPVFFIGVRSLTAHATHPSLKHALAEFFQRVAVVYGFSP